MNQISAGMHKSRYATSQHPVLFIDGVPLEKWCEGVIADQHGSDSTDGLVPAQGWLLNDSELENAWYLLGPREERTSTIVPILICPDDMDMACTVAVVEQVTDDQYVVWTRVGRATDVRNGFVVSVDWATWPQIAMFEKTCFSAAVAELRRLTLEVWC